MGAKFDIDEVIQKSTSQVSLTDLTRKGVKRVKVLNQTTIKNLIAEAVDRVIAQRADELTVSEREKIIEQSRLHFEALARKKIEEEKSRAEQLEALNRTLSAELGSLQKRSEGSDELKAAIERAVERLNAVEAENHELKVELEVKQRQLASASEGLGKEKELEERDREIARRTGELEKKARELAAREADIREAVEELEIASRQSAEQDGVKDRELQGLREELMEKERFLARLEGELAAKNDEILRLAGTSESPDMNTLKESLEGLRRSISDIGTRGIAAGKGGGASGYDVDPETLLKFADRGDDLSMESNVDKVSVHQKKSSGVKGSLAKLRKLQKGV